MSGFRFVGVLFFAALPVLAQPCEAPPDVKAAINAYTLPPSRPLEERAAAARKVRDRFPADYYAHRFYQDQYVSMGLFTRHIQEEYKALLKSHPGDLLYQMLCARILTGANTREAIVLLYQILEKQPDYVLAHLKLTEIYSAPAFLDLHKQQTHLEAYWRGCPSSLTGYSLIRRIDDLAFLKRAAANLRKLLTGRPDNEAVSLYGTLWSLEFKGVPLIGQERVRERIRADAVRLRAMEVEGQPYLLTELSQAYRVLGDNDGLKWVEDQMLAQSATDVINRWHRDNRQVALDREVYEDALLRQTAKWIEKWPDNAQVRNERFTTLRNSQGAPLQDTVQAAEDWIRIYQAHPTSVSPYMTVANFYAQFRIRYSELPGLVEKALAQLPPPEPASVSDLYLPVSRPAAMQSSFARFSDMNSAVSIYLQIGKYDKAREWLARLGPPLLETIRSATDAEKQSGSPEFVYWKNTARLARVEGRKLDALEAERSAYFASPSYDVSALREEWKAMKGTDQGFDAWVTKSRGAAPAPPPKPNWLGWVRLHKPLPDFEMPDAKGKTWRLAELKGKVTLINLWATWCGPCQAELPYMQRLFDKVRGRKDLAVLTLNTDQNLGLVLPFLQDNKYTFPVLAADAYVQKLVPELSIPRIWIVDTNGVLRAEHIGFVAGDEKWVDEMIARMEMDRRTFPYPEVMVGGLFAAIVLLRSRSLKRMASRA